MVLLSKVAEESTPKILFAWCKYMYSRASSSFSTAREHKLALLVVSPQAPIHSNRMFGIPPAHLNDSTKVALFWVTHIVLWKFTKKWNLRESLTVFRKGKDNFNLIFQMERPQRGLQSGKRKFQKKHLDFDVDYAVQLLVPAFVIALFSTL